ncbi:MAG: helix-turn-helix domain-containing protein [Bifidobacteriaceae bacterium]|nr:helix-turn-helix domain-containing protein [Bifidobacteriaceae bacterium]
MAIVYVTSEEVEGQLGRQFRRLRLDQNRDQAEVAASANISLSALKSLEAGRGSSLRTVIRAARALGRLDWLSELHPEPEVSPIAVWEAQFGRHPRQRASRRPS